MVVCIPRVFSVIACIWWWVYLVLSDGGVVFVWLFELFSLDFFSSFGIVDQKNFNDEYDESELDLPEV